MQFECRKTHNEYVANMICEDGSRNSKKILVVHEK